MKYHEYVLYAAGARLRSEVSNSYLNWLWWILEPFLEMIVYIIVFGYFLHMSEEYYPIFLFIGISMWSFFARCVNGSVGLIKRNRSIITKIYIPKSILLLKDICVNVVKMLLAFVIVAFMMLGYHIQLGLTGLFALPVLLVFIMLTYGVSCFFLHFGVYYEDLEYATSILLNILMYFSGIFYSIERYLPGETGRILLAFNPVAFLITSMRHALIDRRGADTMLLVLWFILACVLCICGVLVIRRNENNYVKLR